MLQAQANDEGIDIPDSVLAQLHKLAEDTVKLSRPDLWRDQAWINGQWRHAHDGHTFPVHNPATGQEIARRSHGQQRNAACSDQGRLPSPTCVGRQTGTGTRNFIAAFLSDLMQQHQEDLARIVTWNKQTACRSRHVTEKTLLLRKYGPNDKSLLPLGISFMENTKKAFCPCFLPADEKGEHGYWFGFESEIQKASPVFKARTQTLLHQEKQLFQK